MANEEIDDLPHFGALLPAVSVLEQILLIKGSHELLTNEAGTIIGGKFCYET